MLKEKKRGKIPIDKMHMRMTKKENTETYDRQILLMARPYASRA